MGSNKENIWDTITGIEPYVWRQNDEFYIDATSGFLQCSLGHNSSIVTDAIRKHSSFKQSSYEDLRQTLEDRHSSISQWRFAPSHSLAMELAIMSAFEMRQEAVGKVAHRILHLPRAYHGWSLGTAHIAFQLEHYRRPYDIMEVSFEEILRDEVPTYLLETDFDAFIIESVQRTSGSSVGEEGLNRLMGLCKKNDSYLIADESVTAFCRCGKNNFLTDLYFHTRTPDITVVGEQLGQGLPIATVGLNEDRFPEDFHPEVGWNYANPFMCGVANEILSEIEPGGVGINSLMLGRAWEREFPDDSRYGSLIHLHLGLKAKEVCQKLFDKKIIAMVDGTDLCIAPCFTMPSEVNNYIIETVKEVIEDVVRTE